MEHKKQFKAKVGDRVWLKIPANGTIKKIGKYGYSVELDEILKGTTMEYFAADEADEIEVI